MKMPDMKLEGMNIEHDGPKMMAGREIAGQTRATLSQDHRAMRSKFRYLSKFTAASRAFQCNKIHNSTFELNSINDGKITALNISIYCL